MSQDSAPPAYFDFVPTDLVLIGLLGGWTAAVGTGALTTIPSRSYIGLLGICFAPGYALVAALFPRVNATGGLVQRVRTEITEEPGPVSLVERLLLGVALSLAIVPLVGLGLTLLQVELTTASFLPAVGGLTVALAVVAAVRRGRTHPRERFNLTVLGLLGRASGGNSVNRPPLFVFLVIGVLVAGAGIGIAVLNADRSAEFTEFGLVTEDPETGEFVADEYPTELPGNGSDDLHVTITNNEGQAVEYTVVVLLQSFENGQLQAAERLDTTTVSVQPGQTVREQPTLRPQTTGDDLRLTYLLYKESPPPTDRQRTDTAYRHVHIWVDVPG